MIKLKYIYIIIACVAFNFFGLSQGLYNNGANIVFSGAAQLYIDDVTNGNYLTVVQNY